MHHTTDLFHQFIRLVQDSVPHAVKISGGRIRPDNSKFLLKISFISNGSFKGVSQANPVVGVNPFPKMLRGDLDWIVMNIQRGIGGLRIKTENSEMFL